MRGEKDVTCHQCGYRETGSGFSGCKCDVFPARNEYEMLSAQYEQMKQAEYERIVAPTKERAESAERELNELRNKLMSRSHELGRTVSELLAAYRTIDELRAKLEARDVCWHCKDCLMPEIPRCEHCPEEPGACDIEDCDAPGCLEYGG